MDNKDSVMSIENMEISHQNVYFQKKRRSVQFYYRLILSYRILDKPSYIQNLDNLNIKDVFYITFLSF